MNEEEAWRKSRLDFGGMDQVKEECRQARGSQWIDDAARDLRYAVRSLRKSPGFSIIVVSVLALAIGANTAIFSALEGVVLDPLPFRDPDRLVLVALFNPALKSPTFASYPDFLDWQRSSRSFEQIGVSI